MTDPDTERILHAARAHVRSLLAAGIAWLPPAPPRGTDEELKPMSESPSEPAAAPAKTSTEAERLQSLHQVATEVAGCTRCAELCSTRTQTVFGVGRLDPEICFVGEAPGADEDQQGEPFVGAAGQLLNKIITACGLQRKEVYICNILKCRPPGNRLPQITEAANCRTYLEQQLGLIQPQYICALGACAAQNLLGTTAAIGKLRGRFLDYKGIPVLCTYHPAYLLRNPSAKREVWEDMKLLLRKLGKPIPGVEK